MICENIISSDYIYLIIVHSSTHLRTKHTKPQGGRKIVLRSAVKAADCSVKVDDVDWYTAPYTRMLNVKKCCELVGGL